MTADYFDVIKFDESRAAMLIGDVMGKGMPWRWSANPAGAGQGLPQPPPRRRPALCEQISRAVCGYLPEGKYITFFYGLFETVGRRFVYANAGHNPPLLVRRDGQVARLSEGRPCTRPGPESRYEHGGVRLRAGGRLLCFTDGITEAANDAGEFFGEERLLQLLVEHRRQSAAELIETILAAVADFSGGVFRMT